MEIPVRIYGTQSVTGAHGGTGDAVAFDEETRTLILFPKGAVVRLAANVEEGQIVCLTNLRTQQVALCRVVNVKHNPQVKGYVEIEFTQRAPSFWGVSFPAEGSRPLEALASPPAMGNLQEKMPRMASIQPGPAPGPAVSKEKPAHPFAPSLPGEGASFEASIFKDLGVSAIFGEPGMPATAPPPVAAVPPAVAAPTEVALRGMTPTHGPESADAPAAELSVSRHIPPGAHEVKVEHVAHAAPPAGAETTGIQQSTGAASHQRAPSPGGHDPKLDALPSLEELLSLSFPGEAPKDASSDAMPSLSADHSATAPAAGSSAMVPPAAHAEEGDEAGTAPAENRDLSVLFREYEREVSPRLERSVHPASMGTRLEESASRWNEREDDSRRKLVMIGAAVAALVVVLVTSAFFIFRHSRSSTAEQALQVPAALQTPVPPELNSRPGTTAAGAATDQPLAPPAQVQTTPQAARQPRAQTLPGPGGAAGPQGQASAAAAPLAQAKTQAPAKERPNALPGQETNSASIALQMAANNLSAHALAPSRRSPAGQQPPNIVSTAPDGAPGEQEGGVPSGMIPGAVASLGSVAPLVKPNQPAVPVGGNAVPAKLVSSVIPVYPAVARQNRVQGDVVVRTDIDASGKVIHVKVVSGPALLQDAALAAVRKWRYEPSRLNGQPVATQLLVTLKFRLQ